MAGWENLTTQVRHDRGLIRVGLVFRRALAFQNVPYTVSGRDFLTKPLYYLVANRNVAFTHTLHY